MSCPKYTISDYKSSSISITSIIKFHYYILFSTCFIHGLIGEGSLRYNLYEVGKTDGEIRSRKMLTLKELVISNLMYDVYLSSLYHNIYHVHYVQILSKNICGRLGHDACYSKPRNIYTIRNYAKRMSSNSNLEIQFEILETTEVSRSKDAI